MRSIVSPVISLDRVTKSFQGRRALDEVSATIHPGQFVAVIGRSGAGKTTLLRCLARATTTVTPAPSTSATSISPPCRARRCARTARGSG